ncbi:MAG: hypothetical protein ACSLE6_13245 [Mycobacterium sp.]
MTGDPGLLATGRRDLDQLVVEDEIAHALQDTRFEPVVRELAVAADSDPVRACHLVLRRPQSLSSSYRGLLKLGRAVEGPMLFVGGGVAGGRSAFTVPLGVDDSAAARAVLDDGTALAKDLGVRPVFVSAIPPLAQAARERGFATWQTSQWSSLWVGEHASLSSFIDGYPRKPRQVWRRDRRIADELGAETEVCQVDSSVITAAAPMVTSVAEMNGMRQPVRASEWALSSLVDRPGDLIALRTLVQGRVAAFTFCRRSGNYLDVHTVGVSPDVDNRRDIYQVATYLAPVRFAIESGCHYAGFGTDHPVPKVLRGCLQEALETSRF